MSDETFGQCATLIGRAAIPNSVLAVPTPTEDDAGKILFANDDGSVKWKEIEVPSQTISRIESLDKSNMLSVRGLGSGTYILYGWFKPYKDASSSIAFGSNVLVNIVDETKETHVQVFFPYNNCVQYLKITDSTYERKNIFFNNLVAVGDDVIISSSTEGSSKKFKISVDDSGTISATEYTA